MGLSSDDDVRKKQLARIWGVGFLEGVAYLGGDQRFEDEVASQLAENDIPIGPRREPERVYEWGSGESSVEPFREMTLQQVGDELGLHKSRIAQIEMKAIRKLRHPSRAPLLADFLED